MSFILDNKFNIGEIVYLITDMENLPRIITAMKVFGDGRILYSLCQGPLMQEHYEMEICKEPKYSTENDKST